ncbi:MAG: Cna B-type domain-containing protein [Clostridiales bacterium]|nr:Cna B-type domain-containing protein [Clostridiales bacterium]
MKRKSLFVLFFAAILVISMVGLKVPALAAGEDTSPESVNLSLENDNPGQAYNAGGQANQVREVELDENATNPSAVTEAPSSVEETNEGGIHQVNHPTDADELNKTEETTGKQAGPQDENSAQKTPPSSTSDAIYLNGEKGDDNNSGASPKEAVKTFGKAKELASQNKNIKKIFVLGTVSAEGDLSLENIEAEIYRCPKFSGYLFQVDKNKTATLKQVKVNGNSEGVEDNEKSLIHVLGTLAIEDGTVLQNNHIATRENRRTIGGAVYVDGGILNMTTGLIYNNTATWGGGVYVANRGQFNFSGGTIKENQAISGDISDAPNYAASGGGICVHDTGILNMSGDASVEKNYSEETGGGVAIGNQQATFNGDNLFNMTGGVIDANKSGACGGGLFIQAGYQNHRNKVYISAGQISNNQMLGTGKMNIAFGGGGIYVNGFAPGYNFYNAELYLTNVIIKDNQSYGDGGAGRPAAPYEGGGGYASCPVSLTKVYVTDGGAIYANQASAGGKDLYILATKVKEYGPHGGDPEYEVSPRMLGGVSYDWRDDEGNPVPIDKLKGTLSGDENESLDLTAGQTKTEYAYSLGKVFIFGNTSTTRGGGIGSNGTVIIGKEGPTTDINVQKAWEDKGSSNRPQTVTIHLLANGQDTGETLDLSASNEWKGTFKGLPVTHDKKEIVYTVQEKPEINGYTSSITGDAKNGFTVTNSRTPDKPHNPGGGDGPKKVNVSGHKIWEDGDNQANQRPETITIRLFANGHEVQSVKVTATDNWKWSFSNLPKYDDGKLIEYTISEDPVPGYTTEIDGFNVKNFNTLEKLDISGRKTWDDENNQAGLRPESIVIRLLANGKEIKKAEVTAHNDWQWTFTDLAKYENGKEITYTISEDPVPGYTAKIDGFNVRNTCQPNKTSIKVTKIWKDDQNKYGTRPETVIVKLLADGQDAGQVLTLSEANGWTGIFEDLPVYKNERKVLYTVEELSVAGYQTSITGDQTQGFVITNTYKPEQRTRPGKPNQPNAPKSPSGGAPQTGDEGGVFPWVVLALSASIFLLMLRRKKVKAN